MRQSLDTQLILDEWARHPGPPESPRLSLARQEQIAERIAQTRVIDGARFVDVAIDDMERVAAAAAQMKLKLPKMNERAAARDRVAEYLKRVVTPHMWRRSHFELADRLIDARQAYNRGVMPDGKIVMRWDRKAGLPLLCPDDAREEAMRLSRRMVPALVERVDAGCHAHYAVLTMPNASPGSLRDAQRYLWRRFNSLMRACKRTKSRPFPIVGAVAVLESPLGHRRDWHPHLNVILVCDGYLDYEAFRARWHWNCELRKLDDPKLSPAKQREAIARSFRELIKYSCRAVPEKSEEGAALVRLDRDGNEIPPAPALIEWTAGEFIEWWEAHRGTRRTRSYQALYRVTRPAKLDTSAALWVAHGTRQAHGYVERSPDRKSVV